MPGGDTARIGSTGLAANEVVWVRVGERMKGRSLFGDGVSSYASINFWLITQIELEKCCNVGLQLLNFVLICISFARSAGTLFKFKFLNVTSALSA